MSSSPSDCAQVHDLFAHIAHRYDLANTILSLGTHHLWNRKLVKSLHALPSHDYLDLCAGTGAISSLYLKRYQPTGRVVLLDFCEPMLAIARQRFKSAPSNIEYLHGDALEVPYGDASFDRLTLAYGLRNLKDPQKGLQECYRLLRSEGVVAILELTRPSSKALNWLHKKWLRYFAGPLVGALSQTPQAYEYLQASIEAFSRPEEVLQQLKALGFQDVRHLPLWGQIASIFIARKP